jgi:hypothetical protein
MPPFGLGRAGRTVPLAEAKTARQRFRAAASAATAGGTAADGAAAGAG